MREVYATLLDLEQKGYVSIEQSSFGSHKITKLQNDYSDLAAHEKFVIEAFEHTSEVSIATKIRLSTFKKIVARSLANKGLIKHSYVGASFLGKRIVGTVFVLNTVLTVLFLFAPSAGEVNYADKIIFVFILPLLFSTITIPVSIVLGLMYNKIVGDTGQWTKKMKKSWAEIAGYNEFVRQVELDNIQFESEGLKSKTKIKALPYAVALGLNTSWQKRFK